MEITEIVNTVNQLLQTQDLVNEESTKMYLILPFLSYLGYAVNSPLEVVYEYECDMHEYGSRRVDCAILDENRTPLILIEAKALNVDLDRHWGQTKSYLVSSEARYALLTNGNEYAVFGRSQIDGDFYSAAPLHTFSLTNISPNDFDLIRKLAKINIKPLCNTHKQSQSLVHPNATAPQKAYDYLCHWIIQNIKMFRPTKYSNATQGECWGCFEYDMYNNPHTCCIIKPRFIEALHKAGFDPNSFLLWASTEKIIRRDSSQYAKSKRIVTGGSPVRCIFLKLPKDFAELG